MKFTAGVFFIISCASAAQFLLPVPVKVPTALKDEAEFEVSPEVKPKPRCLRLLFGSRTPPPYPPPPQVWSPGWYQTGSPAGQATTAVGQPGAVTTTDPYREQWLAYCNQLAAYALSSTDPGVAFSTRTRRSPDDDDPEIAAKPRQYVYPGFYGGYDIGYPGFSYGPGYGTAPVSGSPVAPQPTGGWQQMFAYCESLMAPSSTEKPPRA